MKLAANATWRQARNRLRFHGREQRFQRGNLFRARIARARRCDSERSYPFALPVRRDGAVAGEGRQYLGVAEVLRATAEIDPEAFATSLSREKVRTQ